MWNVTQEEKKILSYLDTTDFQHLDRCGDWQEGLPAAYRIPTSHHPMNETNNMLSTEFVILLLFNSPAYVERREFCSIWIVAVWKFDQEKGLGFAK